VKIFKLSHDITISSEINIGNKIYIYIYNTDLGLNNASELLTEIPQNSYIKYVNIIIQKIVVMPHSAHIIIRVKRTRA
jgi:hypothetical protein